MLGSRQLCFLSFITLIQFLRDAAADLKLTELVTDALVLQQGWVVEGVPAVQDPGVAAQRGDAAQRQHRVVDKQRGRLLPQPG